MDETRPLADRLTTALFLGILVLASLNLRVRLSTFTPRYDLKDETGYFRTESAYQYRYARMIAEGKPVPEVDKDAQFPEGVRPTRELTPLMEYATGWAYRLVAALTDAPDFRWFVILWVAAFSSLAIPAFYLLARRQSGKVGLALAASSAYGLSWAAQSNMVATYVFESFALPLMLAALACLAAALDGADERRRRVAGVGAGLFLAGALWSWHLARFYWASLLLGLCWLSWLKRKDPPALLRIREALTAITAILVPASLMIGCLRESAFVFSPAMIVGCGLLFWLWKPQQLRLAAGVTAIALAAAALRSRDVSTYGHVYSYLFDRLRFGLARPADPALLSAEARSIWNGPADSPSLGFLFFSLFPLGLIALPRAIGFIGKDRPEETMTGRLIDALAVLYAAGTALALRLMPFLVFFLCLWSLRLPKRLARVPTVLLLLVVMAAAEGFKTYAPASRLNPFIRLAAAIPSDDDKHPNTAFVNEKAVINWLRLNAAGKPVLSDIAFSANFLAYSGSPVLIHPKYEAAGLRAKVAEYLKALYSDEAAFYAYCAKYGAKVFVLTVYDLLDETPDGTRYTSGSMRLTPQTAAVLLHFAPQSLKHFRLLYQNEDFRIFAVGEKPETRLPPDTPAIYDLAQFSPQTPADGSLKLDVQDVLARIRTKRRELFLAGVFVRLRRGEEALAAYERAFAAWPPAPHERAAYENLKRLMLHGR